MHLRTSWRGIDPLVEPREGSHPAKWVQYWAFAALAILEAKLGILLESFDLI